LVCTSHCQFNGEESCHPNDVSCCPESNPSHESNHDCNVCITCGWTHTGIYWAPQDFKGYTTSHLDFVLNDTETLLGETLSNQFSLSLPNVAPPDFIKSWQFVFRTALPARAPSHLS